MWPEFSMQFNVGLLSNHAAGEAELISSYIYQLLAILSVLGLILKLQVIPFKRTPDHVNVASIELVIQFWVLEQACNRRGRTNHFVDLPIFSQFWHS